MRLCTRFDLVHGTDIPIQRYSVALLCPSVAFGEGGVKDTFFRHCEIPLGQGRILSVDVARNDQAILNPQHPPCHCEEAA